MLMKVEMVPKRNYKVDWSIIDLGQTYVKSWVQMGPDDRSQRNWAKLNTQSAAINPILLGLISLRRKNQATMVSKLYSCYFYATSSLLNIVQILFYKNIVNNIWLYEEYQFLLFRWIGVYWDERQSPAGIILQPHSNGWWLLWPLSSEGEMDSLSSFLSSSWLLIPESRYSFLLSYSLLSSMSLL